MPFWYHSLIKKGLSPTSISLLLIWLLYKIYSSLVQLHVQIVIWHSIKFSFLLSRSNATKVDQTCEERTWMRGSNLWLLGPSLRLLGHKVVPGVPSRERENKTKQWQNYGYWLNKQLYDAPTNTSYVEEIRDQQRKRNELPGIHHQNPPHFC